MVEYAENSKQILRDLVFTKQTIKSNKELMGSWDWKLRKFSRLWLLAFNPWKYSEMPFQINLHLLKGHLIHLTFNYKNIILLLLMK
jgi:hypothetical protein